MLPFHMASEAEFQAARDLFTFAGFTAEAVCRRLGIPGLPAHVTLRQGRTSAQELNDPLDLLIRIFLDGEPVTIARVEELMPPGGIAALRALDILRAHPDLPDSFAASVQLYPIRGLWIASDLDAAAPGIDGPAEPRPDHVFSAITPLSATYYSDLPDSRCERFLELCGGTGIAALLASPSAGHVWSTDITARSTEFADFNARLNGITNFSALQGDLYEPVRGLTFDRIVAHPPYVAAPETRMIFRDGGADGEQIIRGILAGLPEYLEPGGTFYCTCLATERKGAPLEARLREMLGAREKEFDLLLMTREESGLGEYYAKLAVGGRIPYAGAERHIAFFRDLEVTQMTYSSFILQRHAIPREPLTLRRQRVATATARDSDWLRAWATARADGTALEQLLEAAPRISPHCQLQVTHEARGGEWAVSTCQLRVSHPFPSTVDISFNGAMLLNLCDGSSSTRDIIARLREAGAIGAEVGDAAFGEFVMELVSQGVLLLDEAPLAAAAIPGIAALHA